MGLFGFLFKSTYRPFFPDDENGNGEKKEEYDENCELFDILLDAARNGDEEAREMFEENFGDDWRDLY